MWNLNSQTQKMAIETLACTVKGEDTSLKNVFYIQILLLQDKTLKNIIVVYTAEAIIMLAQIVIFIQTMLI